MEDQHPAGRGRPDTVPAHRSSLRSAAGCLRTPFVGRSLRGGAVLLVVVATVLTVAGCGESQQSSSVTPPSPFAGSTVATQLADPDFSLRDQDGRMVSLGGERGRWVVVTFMYTRCPDVCPLIAEQLGEVLRQLGPARGRVRILAVSVDPPGDTPARVRRFIAAHRLSPEFRYLTGSRAVLQPIWREYHVAAQVGPVSTSTHSAYELLIDPAGKPRLLYTADLQARDLLHDLHALGLGRSDGPGKEPS